MTEKAIRLAVLLVSGGVSGAASVGVLLHTNRLTEQALTGHAAPTQARSTTAPTLTLKNGAQLDGQILASTEQWVKIRVPDLGELTIPREQIAALNNQGTPAPTHQYRTPQTPPIGVSRHTYRGKKKPQLSDYERTEREAQRAIEQAARRGEKERVKELKAIIRQSRQAQGEIHEQKKASERAVAQREKERKRQASGQDRWEQQAQEWGAKWQTGWGDAPKDGEFTPIPRVSSRPSSGRGGGASSASTSASSKNWMNWVTGDDRKLDLIYNNDDIELYNRRHKEVCSQGGRILSPDGTAAIRISCP